MTKKPNTLAKRVRQRLQRRRELSEEDLRAMSDDELNAIIDSGGHGADFVAMSDEELEAIISGAK